MVERQEHDFAEYDPVISNHLAGRIVAALYILGGFLTIAMGYLANSADAKPRGLVLVGLAAVSLGYATWLLPWDRWPRSWTAAVVFPSFALMIFYNVFSANEPFRYGFFFVVIFLWIGLMYTWRGLILAIPPFLIAYLVPLAVSGQITRMNVTSAGFVLAVSLLIGGTVAWVTHRLQTAHAELIRKEERFRLLLLQASDIIEIVDRDGTIRYVGASIGRTMGYQPEALVDTDVLEQVHPEDADRLTQAITACYRVSGPSAPIPVRYRRADGIWRQLEVVMTNQVAFPAIGGLVLNARDVTERAEVEEQLAWQASHDSLTGLENRAAFAARAATVLRERSREATVAVLFIDLDNFKNVNDECGHAAGDELLKVVADRLRAAVRPSDALARQGGDEFTVLLVGQNITVESSHVAERLLASLASPFAINGSEITSRASIGIAVADEKGVEVGTLLQQADSALYEAKRQGKGQVVVFAPGMRSDREPPKKLAGSNSRRASAGSLPAQRADVESSPPALRIRPLTAT